MQRGSKVTNPMSPQETTDNMNALLSLIRAMPDSYVEIEGELLRQLGRFDDAVSVLESLAKDSETAACILGLAHAGKVDVGVVHTTQGSLNFN